jgi:hypothetical protein
MDILSKKMTIFDLNMIFGQIKEIFLVKPFYSFQIRKKQEIFCT